MRYSPCILFVISVVGTDLAAQGGHVARRTLTGVVEREVSGVMVVGGEVIDYAASGGRAVYAADQELDGRFELYGVPADGSRPPVKLNGFFVTGGSIVTSFPPSASIDISADGTRAVYLADAEVDGRNEAYSVVTDGSLPPVKLNGPLEPGTSVIGIAGLSPDGSRFVYFAHEAGSPGFRVRSVPATGGASTILAGAEVVSAAITPDSMHVVFRNTRLRVVPIAGGTSIDLSGVFEQLAEYEVTPDSSRIVFRAQAVGNPMRLYTTPLSGGAPVALSPAGGEPVLRFSLSEDGSRVFFVVAGPEADQDLLYSVAVDLGAPAVLMHDPLLDLRSYGSRGAHVLMHLQGAGFPPIDDWVATALDGSAAVTMPLAEQHALAPGGALVVLRQGDSLLTIPAEGGTSAAFYTRPGIQLYGFTPGGRAIVRKPDNSYWTVPLSGGPDRGLISAEADFAGQLQFVAADRWLFLGTRDDPDVTELYTAGIEPLEVP